MPSLVSTWYGTFLVDGASVVERRLAPQRADAIAARLSTMRSDQVLPEERELGEAATGTVTVHERRLRPLGTYQPDGPAPSPDFDPRASGYSQRLLHDALLHIASDEAHLELSDRDRIIVHEVRALDEIVKAANTLAERLREWYAIHAPELVAQVRDHADLARIVSESDDRSAVAKRIGMDWIQGPDAPPAADEAIIRTFAQGLDSLYRTWAEIETRLAAAMVEVAPNLATVAGPMLGARLIASAGGLERLAIAPSGTVQTLGAENALFRHMKDGSPPPKHGLLFQFEAVNRAPWWQRGKIARALSGKVAIAAKADAFGTDPTRGEALLADFQARLAEIQAQHPKPPDRRRGGPPRAPGGRPPSAGRGPPRGRGSGRGRP